MNAADMMERKLIKIKPCSKTWVEILISAN